MARVYNHKLLITKKRSNRKLPINYQLALACVPASRLNFPTPWQTLSRTRHTPWAPCCARGGISRTSRLNCTSLPLSPGLVGLPNDHEPVRREKKLKMKQSVTMKLMSAMKKVNKKYVCK